jgi:hypothetical protein
MSNPTRLTLTFALLLAMATGLSAQPTETASGGTAAAADSPSATAEEPPATATDAEGDPNPEMQQVQAQNTRVQFSEVVERHPRELASILALDPSLLSNEQFLARYPDLEDFVQNHPEVERNPHYYVRDFGPYYQRREPTALERAVEMLSITFVIGLSLFALTWLVRTIIEQKRWNQLSRRQAEVHSRILDRFSTSEELLTYVKSAAGAKFLESAPIAVHAEPRPTGPVARLMWSVQFGVIAAAAGVGILLVSSRFEGETGQGFFAMGAITLSIGAGFIVSALVSAFVARRFDSPPTVVDDAGLMR